MQQPIANSKISGQGVGMILAAAALLVNGPRLVQIFLAVDGIKLPHGAEAVMLGLTGIATGIVLSGGGMYLAHTLALPGLRQGPWRWILGVIWLLLLAFCVILIAPMLVYGVQNTGMVSVLNSPALQWGWAIVAVLAVEVLAAGAMIANALESEVNVRLNDALNVQPNVQGKGTKTQPERLGAGPNDATKRLGQTHLNAQPNVQPNAQLNAQNGTQTPPLNGWLNAPPNGTQTFNLPKSNGQNGAGEQNGWGLNGGPNAHQNAPSNGQNGAAKRSLNDDLNGLNGAVKRPPNASSNDLNGGPNAHPNGYLNAQNGVSQTHLNVQPNVQPNAQTGGLNTANDVRLDDKETALKALVSFYSTNPNGSYSEAGEVIGRSKGTVSGYVKELEERGVIERANGMIYVRQAA